MSVVEKLDPDGLREMDELFQSLVALTAGKRGDVVVSVLLQFVIGRVSGETTDDVQLARLAAMLSVLSLFELNAHGAQLDDLNLATAVDNFVAIASSCSAPLVIPGLVHTVVALKAAGRRNYSIEDGCLKRLRSVLADFERELSDASRG